METMWQMNQIDEDVRANAPLIFGYIFSTKIRELRPQFFHFLIHEKQGA